MKSKKIFVLLAALALSLAACGPKPDSSKQGGGSQSSPETSEGAGSSEQGGGEIAVTSVSLDQTTLALEVGKSANLKATVLPENASNNKVTWEIDDATIASVSQLGKVTALKVGNAKITAKSQSNPEIKAECQLTVSEEGGKYGSLNKPKTVAEILAIAAEECKADGDKTADVIYVKGKLSKAPTLFADKGYSQGIYLKDQLTDENELWVYSANHDALKTPYQNDEVILHGYLMNYKGAIEVSNVTLADNSKVYPEIDSIVDRGTSTITYNVENGSVNADAPRSGKNLSEFTFSITPAANYKVDRVAVNGEAVTAQADGSYKGIVKNNTTVVIDISPVGVEVLSAVLEYKGGPDDSYTKNMTGGNDAALVGLDATLFEVVSTNTTGIYAGLNKSGEIRLYDNRKATDTTQITNGTTLIVSSRRATITKIVIELTSTSAGTMEVKAGDTVITGNEGQYQVNGAQFSIQNVSRIEDPSANSKHVVIKKVTISYTMNQEVHATAIALDKATLEIEEGKDAQLAATLTPANATDVVAWSSDTAAVATVDQTGKVTAVAPGNAVITAKVSDSVKATCAVKVTAAAVINYGSATAPLTVAEAKAVLDQTGANMSKQPLFIKGIVSTNKAFNTQYHNGEIWLQSDDGTVEKAFELYSCEIDSSIPNASSYETADALKGCEVIATGYGKIYSPTYELTNNTVDGVRVNPKIISLTPPAATDPTGITLNKTSVALEAGEDVQLTATLEPAGAVGTVIWSSDAEAVATVDQTGKVLAVAAGSAVITAKVSDTVKATCAVTVSAVDPSAPKMVMVDAIAAGDVVYLASKGPSMQYAGPNKATADAIGTAAEYVNKPSADGLSLEVAAGSASGTFAFKITSGTYANKYLAWSSGNSLKVSADLDANSSWKVSFDADKNATIKNSADETRVIWWNVSSPRFACYTGKSNGDGFNYVQLWKLEGGETPVEIAQPSGTYSGLVSVAGTGAFTTIALANEKAFVEIGSEKATVAYTFDKSTGLVTIPLGGNYGNLTGTYDEENDKLINCGIDGAAAAMVTDNGSLEFNHALVHFDCEGDDAALQATFKRRVGGSENGTVSADAVNFIAGESGVKLPGNGSGDVRLNLRADLGGGSGITAKNLGYWVYNPSSNNVKLRMWIYKAANLGSNAEIASSSGVEFAPGWTYYRIGFTEAKIYNIQIGDFSNSGVTLTFDNIAIF